MKPSPYLLSRSKRAFDVTLTIIGICVAIVPVLIAGIWILIISSGPVLFKQERVGQGEIKFEILKLRTMKVASNKSIGTTTTHNDPRLICGAKLIRALKIDELPQLWNVFIGEMSLVGPRPTTAGDYEKMTPKQRHRALAKPGLSGEAQVSGNTSLNWPERIEFDLHYVRCASFGYDIRVAAKTLGLLLIAKIESHPASNNEWEDY